MNLPHALSFVTVIFALFLQATDNIHCLFPYVFPSLPHTGSNVVVGHTGHAQDVEPDNNLTQTFPFIHS